MDYTSKDVSNTVSQLFPFIIITFVMSLNSNTTVTKDPFLYKCVENAN